MADIVDRADEFLFKARKVWNPHIDLVRDMKAEIVRLRETSNMALLKNPDSITDT